MLAETRRRRESGIVRRTWWLVMAAVVYVVATATAYFLIGGMGGLQQVALYVANAVALAAATEAWLRVWPTPRSLPQSVSRRAAGFWVSGVVLVSWSFVVVFWILVANHVLPIPLPFLRSLPALVQGRLLNAEAALPWTALAIVLGLIRWRQERQAPWHLGVWELGLMLWLLLVNMGVGGLMRTVDPLAIQQGLLVPAWDHFDGWWTPILFAAQLLINGLPEEVLFRGIVLRDILVVVRNNTGLAFGLMALVFDVGHIPRLVVESGPTSWSHIVLVTLFPTTVAACFFGYLYLRTKSLIPGIGLHTFTTLWGVLV